MHVYNLLHLYFHTFPVFHLYCISLKSEKDFYWLVNVRNQQQTFMILLCIFTLFNNQVLQRKIFQNLAIDHKNPSEENVRRSSFTVFFNNMKSQKLEKDQDYSTRSRKKKVNKIVLDALSSILINQVIHNIKRGQIQILDEKKGFVKRREIKEEKIGKRKKMNNMKNRKEINKRRKETFYIVAFTHDCEENNDDCPEL